MVFLLLTSETQPTELQDECFQTKSFYRLLENYTITKDGKLVHDSAHRGKTVVPYTGDLSFYTSKGSRQDNNFEWFEYLAEFKDGQLQSISRAKGGEPS